MGIASTMEENMKKNMEAQMKFQKDLIVKQRQAQLAMQIGMARERFKYYIALCSIAIPGALIGGITKKDKRLFAPILPLSLLLAFQYDMCYGSMLERAREQAEDLILNHSEKFYFPAHAGLVSQEEYIKIINSVPK